MKIGLVGYGMMGKKVHQHLKDSVVCIVDKFNDSCLSDLSDYHEHLDVIIDFSSPDNLKMICDYAKTNKTNLIIATTGHSEEQLKLIDQVSKEVAIVKSANFSLGVILLNKILKDINPILKEDYDIEIVEKHHNKKVDSPSGTAKMLIDTINSTNDYKLVYGREGFEKREKNELGVFCLRGGSVVGEHEVNYFGEDETITLIHKASNKDVFVKGAILASKFLANKTSGLYNMEDVLFNGGK